MVRVVGALLASVQHGTGGLAFSIAVENVYLEFWMASSTALVAAYSTDRSEPKTPDALRLVPPIP